MGGNVLSRVKDQVMKIKNEKKLELKPQELTIRTQSLVQSLAEYPKDGAILIEGNKRVVMRSAQRGRILCNVTLQVYVQEILK